MASPHTPSIALNKDRRGILSDLPENSLLFSAPLACLFLGILTHYISFLDMNKRVYNHVPGECGFVGGLDKGAICSSWLGDKTIITAGGSDLNNATNATATLFAWEVGEAMAKSLEWSGRKPASFNPYGIGTLPDTVMVISNRRQKSSSDSVEILTLNRKTQQLKRRRKPVSSALFTSLTSVVPISDNKFYVTNMYHNRKTWLQLIEFFGHFKMGSILYFDGKTVSTVVSSLAQPSGMTKDGNMLYVSLFGDSAVHVYEIVSPMNLRKVEVIPVRSPPHFITKEQQNNAFLLAVHPLKLRYIAFNLNPHYYMSPSKVIQLKKTKSNKWRLTQLYANDGATIKGVSSALRLSDNQIALGNVHQGLLKCHLTSV